MGFATHERHAFCDALAEVGPDAPTLCEGWTAHDLAAHAWVREHDPLALPGLALPLAAGLTEARMARVQARWPFAELVQRIRRGPAGLFALPGLDEAGNTGEYLVHTEDVRRANDLPRRSLPAGLSDAVWHRLPTMARLLLRDAPVGVRFERDGGTHVVVHPGTEIVTVVGAPAELLLWAFGRRSVADVRLVGTDKALAAIAASASGF